MTNGRQLPFPLVVRTTPDWPSRPRRWPALDGAGPGNPSRKRSLGTAWAASSYQLLTMDSGQDGQPACCFELLAVMGFPQSRRRVVKPAGHHPLVGLFF